MPRPRRKLLRGADLLQALSRTLLPVKWIAGRDSHHILPEQALCIAKASTYEGKFHNGRVYFIRYYDIRPPAPINFRRWDDRSCLHWGKPVDHKTVQLWDRILAASASVSVP